METYFFMKFTVKRLLGGFVGIDAALRELPGILPAHAPRPEQLAPVVGKHDAHIRAKSIVVYHGAGYPGWQAVVKTALSLFSHDFRVVLLRPIVPQICCTQQFAQYPPASLKKCENLHIAVERVTHNRYASRHFEQPLQVRCDPRYL